MSCNGKILKLGVVPFRTVLDSRTITLQNCEAVPRRARIRGSKTVASLNSGLESNQEEGQRYQAPCIRRFVAGLRVQKWLRVWGLGLRVWDQVLRVEDLGVRAGCIPESATINPEPYDQS